MGRGDMSLLLWAIAGGCHDRLVEHEHDKWTSNGVNHYSGVASGLQCSHTSSFYMQ